MKTVPGITVRPLEESDFQAFLDVQSVALRSSPEVFGSDYDWFDALSMLSKDQRYAKYMHYPYRYLLGAFSAQGELHGMIGFSTDKSRSKIRHKSKIWGMYVAPEMRGKGLATLLVGSVVDTARDIECELIQLAVGTQNVASYQLYLRSGFSVYGTEAKAMLVDDVFVDEYLMVKFLR
jgi:RimJ/RimL family protein N-acetyltransferase